ncbi:MAG: hypothetical protein AB3N22_18160 [Ruegeria sp.]
MGILLRRNGNLTCAHAAPKFVFPVVTGNSDKISGHFVFNPATRTLEPTVNMLAKGRKALRRKVRSHKAALYVRKFLLKARLLVFKVRLLGLEAIGNSLGFFKKG